MAAQSTLRHATEERISVLFDRYFHRLLYLVEALEKSTPLSSKTIKLIATLSFAFTIIGGSIGGYRWFASRRKEHETGRRLLRKNSGLRGKDGKRTIFVPYKDSTSRVTIYPIKSTTFDAHRRLFLSSPRQAGEHYDPALGAPPTSIKAGLNVAFVHQFLSLMSIMVPRWRSKETGLLLTHSFFLALRTYLSLVIARIDAEITRDIVSAKGKSFLLGIAKWLSIGVVSAYTNSMIRYIQHKLSIAFRTRLTRYIHDIYLNPSLAYYKLHNLDGGVGSGADQYITQDLTNFCDRAAEIYSSVGKPFVDLITFNFQLYKSLGPLGLGSLLSMYIVTATLLRKLSPPFGRLKAMEGKKEGEFRSLHARIIANAEEIGFYNGQHTELVYINKGFKDLRVWMEKINRLRAGYDAYETLLLKYTWSAFGYLMTSIPIFLPAIGPVVATAPTVQDQSGGRLKQFMTNKRMMLNLADAAARLMYSMKDLAELAGSTSRVYTLVSTLHRVHANAYPRPRGALPEEYSLSDVKGTLQLGFDGVRLEDVPVVAPGLFPMGGEALIDNLSFVVAPGEHLLITGPNGAGKSAVARIVAGLWPTYRGLTSRPLQHGQDGIMFLPQRVYLTTSTLRDQVTYPHTEIDFRDGGRREADLQIILNKVKLGYLVEREGGWDTRKEWKDVFSGGEKQRMGIARLLYHEPRFAFIDEGTSAVSSDVEGILYEEAKAAGITLITISTRASLKRYHSFTLTLGLGDDASGYDFQRIGTASEKDTVEKELAELRSRLARVEEWKSRREEIAGELNKVWIQAAKADQQELAPPSYEEAVQIKSV